MALYLMTSGEYSGFGIVELLEGPETSGEQFRELRAEWSSGRFQERHPAWTAESREAHAEYVRQTNLWHERREAHNLATGFVDGEYGWTEWLCKNKGFKKANYKQIHEGV